MTLTKGRVWARPFFIILFFLLFPSPSVYAFDYSAGASVAVSAAIEDTSVTIFGYTSPHSRVELSNSQVFALTYSDDIGFFIFDRTILPKETKDICLSSTDDNNRRSVPVCLPAPPDTVYHTDIGPVLLPPTLSLDSGSLSPNQTSAASGQSLPNAQIDIHFYQSDINAPTFPKAVHAFSLPLLTVSTDTKGNYSFTLPSSYSTAYRLFASVRWQDSLSPKSNTLALHLPSLWQLFWAANSWLFFVLPIFVITLSLFFYLIYCYYLDKHPEVPRYLPAVFSYPLALYQKS